MTLDNLIGLDMPDLRVTAPTNTDEVPIPNCVNPDATDEENEVMMAYQLNEVVVVCNVVSSVVNESNPQTFIGTDTDVEESQEEKDAKRLKQLCRYLKTINFLKTILPKLAECINQLTLWVQWLISKPLTAAVKWLLKQIQKTVLFIKKIICYVKLFIAKILRSILIAVKGKNGSWMSAALNAVVIAIFETIKFLSMVVVIVLQCIQAVLNAIPPMLCVSAESMVFFPTPRSIQKTDITAANPNFSIVDRIPTFMKDAINVIINSIKVANAAIAKGIIIAGAAAGVASVFTRFQIPKFICKDLKVLDPTKILKEIDKLLRLFAAPEGLPKYENLKFSNIAFLAFLMTGFCLSGHVAFGFPGCP